MTGTRNRKATDPSQASSKPKRCEANSRSGGKSSSEQHDSATEIVGGLNGDYRITGTEDEADDASSFYKEFTIPAGDDKVIPCRLYGPDPKASSTTKSLLIFTHGAGGGIENPATKLFAEGYGATSMPVLCFQGTMNLLNRVKLFETVLEFCREEYPGYEYAVGGRSMGARAAVMLAANHDGVQKIVAVSYPLISPKGEIREEILLDLRGDKTVFFQSGDKDSMCDAEQLDEVRKKMAASSNVFIKENADHGMSLVGKLEDKVSEVAQFRKELGEMAAKWVRRADSNDETMLTLNPMAGKKEAAAGQAETGRGALKSSKEKNKQAANDAENGQKQTEKTKPASKKRTRKPEDIDKTQNKEESATKKEKKENSTLKKEGNKKVEANHETLPRRRSTRLKP